MTDPIHCEPMRWIKSGHGDWVKRPEMEAIKGSAEAVLVGVLDGSVEQRDIFETTFFRQVYWTQREPITLEVWLTIADACAHLGLTRRALNYRIARGQLRCRLVNGTREVKLPNDCEEDTQPDWMEDEHPA